MAYRYAQPSKLDSNHAEIVKQLRQLGCSVLSIASIKKACDIIVGYKGINYLFEIKSRKQAKLTPGESTFFDSWKGKVYRVDCLDDILLIIN